MVHYFLIYKFIYSLFKMTSYCFDNTKWYFCCAKC